MTRRTRWIVAGAAGLLAAAGIGGGVAYATNTDADPPITGAARERAEAAALAHTGGGTVTETEVGDEEGYYEVEVSLPGGREVDVHLDRDFTVLGSSTETEDEADDADEADEADEADDD
jgi:hypothetical protein